MSTKNPRLNVVLEPPIYSSIRRLAEKDGVSLSLKARDLIKEALETYEDRYWLQKLEKREKTFERRSAQTHKQVWK
ncbi:MAG: antitoxin, RHH family protein [Candidatus Omnitrophica bacterium]|nr:antitoxin, RHH family protein [Candidatus Omnitrophota bacterium]